VVPLASCFRGRALWQSGDPRGRDEVRRALDLARAAGNQEHLGSGYANLIGLEWRYGTPAEDFEASLAAARAHFATHDFPTYTRLTEAYALRHRARRGEWAAAEDGLRELLADPESGGALTRHVLPGLAALAVRRGRDDAVDLLDSAWDNALQARSLMALVPVAVASAELGWLTSDATLGARARELLPRVDGPGRERDRGELLTALQRLGDPVRPFPGCPEEHAAALRGDWPAATAAWQGVGDPYEQGRAAALSGDVPTVLEGLALLDGLGAGPAAALVRRRLREQGHQQIPRGPAPATRANPAGLTGRQAEILRLLAGGMSNAEIAQRLVLSVRTVDHHVSAVLQKLGVTSRRAAATAAAGLGIV
jgi:DNA-binding CsgD family transcriptional regulator